MQNRSEKKIVTSSKTYSVFKKKSNSRQHFSKMWILKNPILAFDCNMIQRYCQNIKYLAIMVINWVQRSSVSQSVNLMVSSIYYIYHIYLYIIAAVTETIIFLFLFTMMPQHDYVCIQTMIWYTIITILYINIY